MKYLKGVVFFVACSVSSAKSETLYDDNRDRNIRFNITFPVDPRGCSINSKCPVVFFRLDMV